MRGKKNLRMSKRHALLTSSERQAMGRWKRMGTYLEGVERTGHRPGSEQRKPVFSQQSRKSPGRVLSPRRAVGGT